MKDAIDGKTKEEAITLVARHMTAESNPLYLREVERIAIATTLYQQGVGWDTVAQLMRVAISRGLVD